MNKSNKSNKNTKSNKSNKNTNSNKSNKNTNSNKSNKNTNSNKSNKNTNSNKSNKNTIRKQGGLGGVLAVNHDTSFDTLFKLNFSTDKQTNNLLKSPIHQRIITEEQYNNYYKNKYFDNEPYLEQIRLNCNENKQYNKLLKDNEEALNTLNYTSFGIYINNYENNNKFIKTGINKLEKKGGYKKIEFYDQIIFTDDTYLNEMSYLLQNVNNFTTEKFNNDNLNNYIEFKQSNEINDILNDESNIDDFISINKYNIENYTNLARFLKSNNEKFIEIKTLEMNNYILTDDGNWIKDDIYTLTKKYIYYPYNIEYIFGYEKLFYDYYFQDNYDIFIREQQNYLENLRPHYKTLLRDYSSVNVFELFISPFRKNIFNINDIDLSNVDIGNPFLYIIQKYLNDATNNNNILARYGADKIESYNNAKNNLNNNYNTLSLQTTGQCDEIYTYLNQNDWENILNYYLDILINKIINFAPQTTKPLILYRGSGINHMDIPSNDIEYFGELNEYNTHITNKLSSFTLNFDAAKKFYNISDGILNEDALIYRIFIHPGVNLLLITPIVSNMKLKNEAEVLLKKGQRICARKLNKYTNMNEAYYAWNSVYMTNNIHLEDENKFKTIDYIQALPDLYDK